MQDFPRIKRLPQYVFSVIDDLKAEAAAAGHAIIDLGMGNPDQPTPDHIVESLVEAARQPHTHRYSASRGQTELRQAICHWYKQRFTVELDYELETIATIGSKEGLAHIALAMMDEGDTLIVPDPYYPVHRYGSIIAGANVEHIPLDPSRDFCADLEATIAASKTPPKLLVINFPSNPATYCVDLETMGRIVAIAKQHHIWVIHDFAYAEITFDGYQPPSILQVPGAKDIAVETYTLSKTYNMAGWRVGFVSGNQELVGALTRIKAYMDYGSFAAIEEAATIALTGPQDCVDEIRAMYQSRRDVLCDALADIGWYVDKPKATMFVWAKIPSHYENMGSLAFTQYLIEQAQVALSPGIAFGESGDAYVRFSLIVDEATTRQAVQRIGDVFRRDGMIADRLCG